MKERTEIRQKVLVDKVSIRQICRDYKISPHTVAGILENPDPSIYEQKEQRPRPKLGPFLGVISQILEDDKTAPPKQRHTAKRIFERLRDEHDYTGSQSHVRRYVGELSGRTHEVFVPLVQPAGEAQFDFGEALVDIAGERVKAHLAVMSLPHSDAFFVSAYPSECTETFQQAHVSAFDYFGGVPTKIAYDNTTIAVKKVMLGPKRELTDGFLRLESHYLFAHRFCRVARGNEKGHVENDVGYHRRNFLVPVPSFASFAQLNDYLASKCFADLDRVVRGESDTNAQRLENDLAAMRALPENTFEARRTEHVTSNSLSLARFHRNDYSVPTAFAHRDLVVVASVDTVRISADGAVVATHARSWAKEQIFFDPLHYLALLERKPGAFDFAKPLKDWALPECFNLLRRRLEADREFGATKEFIKVLRLLETFSLSELSAAVTCATDMGTTSYEAIALIAKHRGEEPIVLFSLDGRAHLAGVGVDLPDLTRYAELVELCA